MATPFAYPKEKHTRKVKAPKLVSYRRYKRHLRKEFEGQCIYCRMPDAISGSSQYGVEHYLPKSVHPELATEYSNLYYCCNICNSKKRNTYPFDAKSVMRIPNPCDDRMYAHLRYKHGTVEGVSKAGKFTVELLDLNDDAIVERREDIIHIIDTLEYQLASLKEAESNLKKKLKMSLITNTKYLEIMVAIEEKRTKSQRALDRHLGKLPL